MGCTRTEGADAGGQTEALTPHWAGCDCPAPRSGSAGTDKTVCAEDIRPLAAATPGQPSSHLPRLSAAGEGDVVGAGRGLAARRTESAERSKGQCKKGTSSNPSPSKDTGSRETEKGKGGWGPPPASAKHHLDLLIGRFPPCSRPTPPCRRRCLRSHTQSQQSPKGQTVPSYYSSSLSFLLLVHLDFSINYVTLIEY